MAWTEEYMVRAKCFAVTFLLPLLRWLWQVGVKAHLVSGDRRQSRQLCNDRQAKAGADVVGS